MGLLAIPTAILVIILIIVIVAVIAFLIFIGILNIRPFSKAKSKTVREEEKFDSLGDQVKARQDRINKESEESED